MEINKGTAESYGYRTVGNIYGEVAFLKDFTFRVTGYADVGINMGSNYNPRFDVNNEHSNSSHKSEKTSFRRNTCLLYTSIIQKLLLLLRLHLVIF